MDGVDAQASLVGAGGPPSSEYQYSTRILSEDQEVLKASGEAVSAYIQAYILPDEIQLLETRIVGLESINRINGDRYITVEAKLSKDADTAVVLQLTDSVNSYFDHEKLEQLGLQPNALSEDLGLEGDFLESLQQLGIATVIAMGLIYVLLVALYRSYLQPILILLAIPLSFPLLFPGLLITDNPLGFLVTLGITGLVGIVVNNTILLVDYANSLVSQGKPASQAITEAIRVRFRPLVTTSLTTVGGIVPLVIADPFWEGLGLTIIFGLTSSTLLVLLAFPSFYMLTESIRNFRRNLARLVLVK